MRVDITVGEMPDLMLRLDSEVAPLARAADGFIGYYAVATDVMTLVTTRIFRDLASLEAETQAASAVSQAIATDFGFSNLEVMIDAPFGVARGYGPIEEFTP